jgi:carbon-monoxide dehydrogenase medium subunit
MVTLQRLGSVAPVNDIGLSKAVRATGNIRVQNAATIGGAVVSGAPDTTTALAGLDARVRITSSMGPSTVPIHDLDNAIGKGPVDTVVTGVEIPTDMARTSTYLRLTARSHPDRPLIAVFASVRRTADQAVEDVRISVGGAGHPPLRLDDLEIRAAQTGIGPDARRDLAAAYAERIDPTDDLRGSAWYRAALIDSTIARALAALDEAAAGTRNGRA